MWKDVLDAFIIIVFAVLFVSAFMSQNDKKRSGPQKDNQDARLFFLAPTTPGPQNQKFLFTPN